MSDPERQWYQIDGSFYRKVPLYSWKWGRPSSIPQVNSAAAGASQSSLLSNLSSALSTAFLDVSLLKFVGAPFGGPVAVLADSAKLASAGTVAVSQAEATWKAHDKPKVKIYTAAGQHLADIWWEKGDIVNVGWTSNEQLVVVGSSGDVGLFSVHGEELSSFSFDSPVTQHGVADVVFWPDGLVIRTGLRSELYAVNDWIDPAPFPLADVSSLLPQPPTAMTVIGQNKSFKVILATNAGSVIVVDREIAQDQRISMGALASLTVSPTGTFVAGVNYEGVLHILKSDFNHHATKFVTGAKALPTQVLWCGDDVVVLAWNDTFLLVNMLGNFIKFKMNEPFTLVPEHDGCRIITNNGCEWLHLVAESTKAIFKAGSNTDAAKLYDAQELFNQENGASDDSMRALSQISGAGGEVSPGFKQAIEQCLNAAAQEFNPETQRKLLKAASYGKLLCPSYKADKFVDMCRILRVLNAVRHTSVGMPITYKQYTKLEGEVLVDRLVNRHQHLLAMRMCDYLKIHPERVLVHWSCQKIRHGEKLSDYELKEMIVKKLSLCPGISYAKIAQSAFQSGRRPLATLLLEYEPLAADQVPLLMSMGENELALNKAIQSGDTDLIYIVLLQLKKKYQSKMKEFFLLIKDKPLARDLFISHCKNEDLPLLKSLYYSLQSPLEAADVTVMEAYQKEHLFERIGDLELAHEFYEKDKSNPLPAKILEEQILLLKYERELEGSGLVGAVDLSATALLEKVILSGDGRKAAKLKSLMKISDKRMWHIEVCALSRGGRWDELAKLVQGKKTTPIGFQPFIEACIQQKNLPEAAKYIQRLSDYQEQMEWLCNIGYWREAADIAGREKDADALLLLRERCRQPPVLQHIERLLSTLSQSGK